MEDAEMLADVKAYAAAKARLEDGKDELIPLEITELCEGSVKMRLRKRKVDTRFRLSNSRTELLRPRSAVCLEATSSFD